MNLGGNVVNLLEFFSKIGLREKDRTDIGGVPETGYLLSDPLRVNNDPSFNDSASVNNVGSFKPSMSTLETFKYDAPEFENLSESSVNYIKNYILKDVYASTGIYSIGTDPRLAALTNARDMIDSILNFSEGVAKEDRVKNADDYIDPYNTDNQALLDELYAKGILKEGMTDDEIAFAVHKYVVENYNYIPDAGDNWSPLGETIRRGGGDCEDLAFLEASLLQGALMRNGMSQGEAQNRVMGVAITDDNGGGHVYVTYVDSTGTQRYLESTGDSVGDAKSVYDLQDASKLNNHILFTFNDDSVNIVDKNYNYSTYETSWNPIGWVKDNIVDPVVDTGKAVVGYVEDNVIDPVVDTVKNVCVDAFKGFYNIFKGIFTGNLGEINDGFTDLGNIPWDALKGVGRLIKGAVQAVPDSITWIYDYFWGDVDLSKFDRTKEMDQHNTDYQNADMSYVYDFEIGEHDNGEDLLTDISRQKDNLLEGVDPEDFYYFDEHGMETIDEQRLEAYYDRAKAICMLQSAIVSILLTESEAKELVDEILNGSSDDEKRKNPLSDLISKSNQGLLQAVNTAIMNFFQEVEGYNYDRYNAMLEEVKKYKDGGGEEFLNVITFGGQDGKISNGNKKVTEWYLAAEERNMNALSAVLDSGEFQGINGYISSQINATLFNMDSYIEDAGNGRIKIDGDRLVGDLRDKLIGLLNMQALLVIIETAKEENRNIVFEMLKGVSLGTPKMKFAAEAAQEEANHITATFDRMSSTMFRYRDLNNQLKEIEDAIERFNIMRPFQIISTALKIAGSLLQIVGFVLLFIYPPIGAALIVAGAIVNMVAGAVGFAGTVIADQAVDGGYETSPSDYHTDEAPGDGALGGLENERNNILNESSSEDRLNTTDDGYKQIDYGELAMYQDQLFGVQNGMRMILYLMAEKRRLWRMVAGAMTGVNLGGLSPLYQSVAETAMSQDQMIFTAIQATLGSFVAHHNQERAWEIQMDRAWQQFIEDETTAGLSLINPYMVVVQIIRAWFDYVWAQYAPYSSYGVSFDTRTSYFDQASEDEYGIYKALLKDGICKTGGGYSGLDPKAISALQAKIRALIYAKASWSSILETRRILYDLVRSAVLGISAGDESIVSSVFRGEMNRITSVFNSLVELLGERVTVMNRANDAAKEVRRLLIMAIINTVLMPITIGAPGIGSALMGLGNAISNLVFTIQDATSGYGDLEGYDGPKEGEVGDAGSEYDFGESALYTQMNRSMMHGTGGGMNSVNPANLVMLQIQMNKIFTARELLLTLIKSKSELQAVVQKMTTGISADGADLTLSALEADRGVALSILDTLFKGIQTLCERKNQMTEARRNAWKAGFNVALQAFNAGMAIASQAKQEQLEQKVADRQNSTNTENENTTLDREIAELQADQRTYTYMSMAVNSIGALADFFVGMIFDMTHNNKESGKVAADDEKGNNNDDVSNEEARSFEETLAKLEDMTNRYKVSAANHESYVSDMENDPTMKNLIEELFQLLQSLGSSAGSAGKQLESLAKAEGRYQAHKNLLDSAKQVEFMKRSVSSNAQIASDLLKDYNSALNNYNEALGGKDEAKAKIALIEASGDLSYANKNLAESVNGLKNAVAKLQQAKDAAKAKESKAKNEKDKEIADQAITNAPEITKDLSDLEVKLKDASNRLGELMNKINSAEDKKKIAEEIQSLEETILADLNSALQKLSPGVVIPVEQAMQNPATAQVASADPTDLTIMSDAFDPNEALRQALENAKKGPGGTNAQSLMQPMNLPVTPSPVPQAQSQAAMQAWVEDLIKDLTKVETTISEAMPSIEGPVSATKIVKVSEAVKELEGFLEKEGTALKDMDVKDILNAIKGFREKYQQVRSEALDELPERQKELKKEFETASVRRKDEIRRELVQIGVKIKEKLEQIKPELSGLNRAIGRLVSELEKRVKGKMSAPEIDKLIIKETAPGPVSPSKPTKTMVEEKDIAKISSPDASRPLSYLLPNVTLFTSQVNSSIASGNTLLQYVEKLLSDIVHDVKERDLLTDREVDQMLSQEKLPDQLKLLTNKLKALDAAQRLPEKMDLILQKLDKLKQCLASVEELAVPINQLKKELENTAIQFRELREMLDSAIKPEDREKILAKMKSLEDGFSSLSGKYTKSIARFDAEINRFNDAITELAIIFEDLGAPVSQEVKGEVKKYTEDARKITEEVGKATKEILKGKNGDPAPASVIAGLERVIDQRKIVSLLDVQSSENPEDTENFVESGYLKG